MNVGVWQELAGGLLLQPFLPSALVTPSGTGGEAGVGWGTEEASPHSSLRQSCLEFSHSVM